MLLGGDATSLLRLICLGRTPLGALDLGAHESLRHVAVRALDDRRDHSRELPVGFLLLEHRHSLLEIACEQEKRRRQAKSVLAQQRVRVLGCCHAVLLLVKVATEESYQLVVAAAAVEAKKDISPAERQVPERDVLRFARGRKFRARDALGDSARNKRALLCRPWRG